MDRLSLSFPVAEAEPDPSAWSKVTVQNPGTPEARETREAKVDLDGSAAFVGVAQMPDGRRWGKVEFNPSRVADPEGWGLAEVRELPGATAKAWSAATALVRPACNPVEAKVKRLDVARDFTGVGSPDHLLRGLGPVDRPWARRNLVHFDPAKRGAQTLMVGSGAGVARLYDKHAETEGRAPEGTLRWEVEARAGWLRQYGGITTLSTVDGSSVEALARNRWDWMQAGAEVGGLDEALAKITGAGLGPALTRGVVGYLVLRARGYEAPAAKATAVRYRRVQRVLGLALEEVGPAGLVVRLDLDAGRAMLRAAA